MRDYRYINPEFCHHHKVNLEKAYRYAKAMEKGDKFPPVHLHIDKDGNYCVRNGAHRTFAAKLAGKKLFVWVKTIHYNFDEYEEYYEKEED